MNTDASHKKCKWENDIAGPKCDPHFQIQLQLNVDTKKKTKNKKHFVKIISSPIPLIFRFSLCFLPSYLLACNSTSEILHGTKTSQTLIPSMAAAGRWFLTSVLLQQDIKKTGTVSFSRQTAKESMTYILCLCTQYLNENIKFTCFPMLNGTYLYFIMCMICLFIVRTRSTIQ